jgi:hypothetical protein
MLSRFLTSCLLLLCAAGASAQSSRAALIQFAPSIVKIEAVDREGRFQLGSGVIIAPGKVVTNCHVTRRAAMVAVLKHGLRLRANGQRADVERDLCLLRVPGLDGDAVPIAVPSSVKPGDPVIALGYTGGLGLQLSDGLVVARHRWSGSDIIQSTNWFTSGASGGALFNGDGGLIGILTFRLRGGESHYFSAPAEWLHVLIADEAGLVPVAPLSGLTFWEATAEAQPFFLQAAPLEQGSQWQALAQLAQRWTGEAKDDAEAFYTQGIALDGLGQTEAAIRALQRCTQIDAAYSRGWVRLALIYRREGRLQDTRAALRTLSTLDRPLAEQMSTDLEKP